MLKNKTIIVGVTGGIAAYKSAEIVSQLKKLNADVWVVMTKNAAQFVGPLTFRTLSRNPVLIDLFDEKEHQKPVPHISLADKADLIVVAPATANIIGKAAQGIADDALSTTLLSINKTKIFAPAMNTKMYENASAQENMAKLKSQGCLFISPQEDYLACGDYGLGKMAEPETIVAAVKKQLVPEADLRGKKVLITAAGTQEAIDPVRFISNRSSGKMGYALAQAAIERGAEVTLISGPTSLEPPKSAKKIEIRTAAEMANAVTREAKDKNIIIMAAAVADYKPKKTETKKKKKTVTSFNLDLERTTDILASLGQNKNGAFLVGFAAETEDLEKNALKKLKEKNLDLIVANDVANGFEEDTNIVKIIRKNEKTEDLPQMPKIAVARKILDTIKNEIC